MKAFVLPQLRNLTAGQTMDAIAPPPAPESGGTERGGTESITDADCQNALGILQKYQNGKRALEERIVAENEWWRMRQWAYRGGRDHRSTPAGAHLFNSIENKIADVSDNLPECSFLPCAADDEETAKTLTAVMPSVIEAAGGDGAYLDVARHKITYGTGVYAVTWDAEKLNGLGDVSVQSVDVLNLYWEPGVNDIQKSENLFYVYTASGEALEADYPVLRGRTGGQDVWRTRYVTDDAADESDKTTVVDWYYKRKVGTRTVVHFVKISCGVCLYASENDPVYAERGYYDHGQYPFVFDTLYPLPESPCGFGFITVGKSGQEQIDLLSRAVVDNAIRSATKRYIYKTQIGVDPQKLADPAQQFIEYAGSGDLHEYFYEMETPTVGGGAIAVLENLVADLKETTANRDFAQGGTAGGVTSGTAIAALVEAGNKQSRMIIAGTYRAYREMVSLAFELVRQFYTAPRVYRITGADGGSEYIPFDNTALQGGSVQMAGISIERAEPVFDIKIRAHRASPYSKASQNELMKNFYAMGFFAPENATVALACLEGMEFDGKDEIKRRIEENGTLLDQLNALRAEALKMAVIIDAEKGTDLARQMAEQFGIKSAPTGSPRLREDKLSAAQNPSMQEEAAAGIRESTQI